MDNLLNSSASRIPARLVFLLQDLKFGGTQRQTLELARLLKGGRFRVEVWLLAGGDDLVPLARSFEVPLVWLSRREHPGPAALVQLWRRLRQGGVDLLALLTVVPNIWGRLLGRLARVPVIVGNCRGGAAPQRQQERWLWPLAHRIICNSAALQKTLMNHHGVPGHRLTVIPNGVDAAFYRPAAAEPGGPPVLLCVARMVLEKDHDTLLRAFALATGTHPRAELWLVGEGPRLEAVQNLAQQLLPAGRVRVLPGQADLRPLFQRASVFVLSSVAEAMPNVVLEAMAAGLPVVATRVGGIPEMVVPGQTGWLTPPGEAAALAAALSQVLENAATRRRFGRAGRERVLGEFSLDSMGRRFETEFVRLLRVQRDGGHS